MRDEITTWGDDKPVSGWHEGGWIEDGQWWIDNAKQPGREALVGYLGPDAKRVVINDYLPPGMLYMTEGEIILSKHGWERLVQSLERKAIVEGDVRAIIETKLRHELAWLRAAGHDV